MAQSNRARAQEDAVKGSERAVERTEAQKGTSGSSKVEHTVEAGENLSTIAEKYGAKVSEIVEASDLRNASIVYVGDKVVVPNARRNVKN